MDIAIPDRIEADITARPGLDGISRENGHGALRRRWDNADRSLRGVIDEAAEALTNLHAGVPYAALHNAAGQLATAAAELEALAAGTEFVRLFQAREQATR